MLTEFQINWLARPTKNSLRLFMGFYADPENERRYRAWLAEMHEQDPERYPSGEEPNTVEESVQTCREWLEDHPPKETDLTPKRRKRRAE